MSNPVTSKGPAPNAAISTKVQVARGIDMTQTPTVRTEKINLMALNTSQDQADHNRSSIEVRAAKSPAATSPSSTNELSIILNQERSQ